MLLNRVLCVIGLYFSPFNEGLIVHVRMGVTEWACYAFNFVIWLQMRGRNICLDTENIFQIQITLWNLCLKYFPCLHGS